MRGYAESTKWEWREGKVDAAATHKKLVYGDAELPVALVANPVGNLFIVECLQIPETDQGEYARIKLAVTTELSFYLVASDKKEPWEVAIYHCGTRSNIYSDVHWRYLPGGRK